MAVHCCNNYEIPRKSSLTKEQFDESFLSKGLPVVIQDGLKESPALKWTLESLCDRVGDNIVHVRSNTNCEDYRRGRKYNIRQTTFTDYVKDLIANNTRAKNSYLAVQNIKKAFPQLQEEFEVPEYVGKVHGGPYLWVAREGHYEYCHFDPDDGLLIVLDGQKMVRLFGCNIEKMYPNDLGTNGRTVQSQVDCNDPDLVLHKNFSGTDCHHCLLEPGEMLYIPAFWWHQVTSTKATISINIFWGNAGTNTFLTKCMRDPVWPSFRHWLLNVIEQNRNCESFPRTLARFPEALYNFLKNQWHEEATDEQLKVLTRLVMEYLGMDQLPTNVSSGKHPPALQIRGLLWRK